MAGDNVDPVPGGKPDNPPGGVVPKKTEELSQFDKKALAYRKSMLNAAKEVQSINDKGRVALHDPNLKMEFKGCYNALTRYVQKFEDYYDKLLYLYETEGKGDEFPSKDDTSKKRTVSNMYNESLKAYEMLFNDSRLSVASGSNVTMNESRSHHLPIIDLPKFDGSSVTEWPKFRDTFNSMVIEEDSLSPVQKYHYLVSSLSGPAASLIKHLPLLERNFDVAWKCLTEVYDQKRVLSASYLNHVISFRPLQGKPTLESYKLFLSQVADNITAFKLLKVPDEGDHILFHLAARCLDPQTREQFEVAKRDVQFPTIKDLTDFVRNRFIALQLANSGSSVPDSSALASKAHPSKNQTKSGKPALVANQGESSPKSPPPKCVVCGIEPHSLQKCAEFNSLTPSQRLDRLKGVKICKNCLQFSHKTHSCTSNHVCKFCKHKHNSLLHLTNQPKGLNSSSPENAESQPSSAPASSLNSTSSCDVNVLLGTVVAEILDVRGRFQAVRIVIDSGSHYSFITTKCLARLGLSSVPSPKRVSGIGQTIFEGIKGQSTCTLRPRDKKSPQLKVEALVVKNITSFLPPVPVPVNIYRHYANYKLADPKFHNPAGVDFLLGADLFSEIWLGSPVTIAENLPKLFNSVFGYIVMGHYSDTQAIMGTSLLAMADESEDLNVNLTRFWELEEPLPFQRKDQLEDNECEEHFKKTHHRQPDGRYVVRLPFQKDPPVFPYTHAIALKRFANLEQKLDKNPHFKEKYTEFMSEYEALDHMQVTSVKPKFVIPHHGITKIDRGKEKIRVVFDASVKTSAGSLNDFLHVGAKLQNSIQTILLNFRSKLYVFVTDIVKMYRGIILDERDRPYQHIVWRKDPSEPIREYQLRTLTYGLGCAPFVALRIIKQLCMDHEHQFPEAAKILMRDSYIDDVASGANSIPAALQLQDEIIRLLECGGFKLSKWASNCPELLSAVPSTEKSTDSVVSLQDSEDTSLKILGLQWDPKSDEFSYAIAVPTIVNTKRRILSEVSKIYDPLGFLAPSVVVMKTTIQDLWKAKVDWDEDIPKEIAEKWFALVSQLPYLSEIKIRRFVGNSEAKYFRLVGFSDASNKAYCAAIYLQVITPDGISSHLLMAKTKLAPVKTISTPRLELCGALLLAQLFEASQSFIENLTCECLPPKFFTDSSIVLAWIKTPSYMLKVFVANRVTKIVNRTQPSSWYHVDTKSNPADCGTRGLLPSELISFHLWWEGPSWLTEPEENWPSSECEIPADLPELAPVKVALAVIKGQADFIKWMSRFSSFMKLIRSVAWIKRCFANRSREKNHEERVTGDFTQQELDIARIICIKAVQCHYFFSGDPSNTNTALKTFFKLQPFIDVDGMMRVGGRLRHSNLSLDHKYPVLLPHDAHFTIIMVDHYHRLYSHPGPSTLQALIQMKYWIPSLRRVVRQRTFHCDLCYKAKAKGSAPIMGDLPPCRLQGGRAFIRVGTDFAGPFMMRESNRRKASLSKVYLCIFICMASKATHLEAVTSLSTEAFLAALTRFTSRRGFPLEIYSDCGLNFIGASNSLKEFVDWYKHPETKTAISEFCNRFEFQWHFNPPYSPNFGGLWEAGVKSSKTIFKKIAGDSPLTFEEISTLFAKVEAILNSRPICPLSNSPEETDYLSPGHFLIGRPLVAAPEPTLQDLPDNRLSRWQVVKKMSDLFWQRWRREYLHTLQSRVKWNRKTPNVEVNDLVLLKGEALPQQWPIAKVIKVHPGDDGVTRVATIRTANNHEYTRPVSKLIPLLPLKCDPYEA